MVNSKSLILRFSGSSNIASLAVKLYTWSWCSHVETIVDNDPKNIRMFGALPSTGVDYRPLDSTFSDRVEQYEVVLSAYKKEQYFKFLLSQKGKPYDFSALFSMVLHKDRDWRKDNAWFCSELVAWAFENAELPLLRADHVNRVTPANLLMSPLLKRIS